MTSARTAWRGVLLSHPGNPPFAQQAARALDEEGLLAGFATGYSYRERDLLTRALALALRAGYADPRRQLARRSVTEIPPDRVMPHPAPELLRSAPGFLRTGRIAEDLVWEQAEKWFDSTVARRHAPYCDAAYAYEHAALSTFQAARDHGARCIYDQPIAHHATAERLLEPEFDRFPDAQTAYDRHVARLAPRRNRRKDQELQLADLVIAASTFTRDSLLSAGVAPDRVVVIPYGAPTPLRSPVTRANGRVVFLSAGQQSVRKGTHYLLDAWKRLGPPNDAELWLVGKMMLPQRLLRGLPGRVTVRDSVPRQELYDAYLSASVLVFPSLLEGFGMVITEAMAHYLPVITTPRTAGPDLFAEGSEGLIVPAGDTDALATAMAWCLDHARDLPEMGRLAALQASHWQWADYRRVLASTVRDRGVHAA